MLLAVGERREAVLADPHRAEITLGGHGPPLAQGQVVLGRAALVAMAFDAHLELPMAAQEARVVGQPLARFARQVPAVVGVVDVVEEAGVDVYRLIIRVVYLGVIAVLLGYLGAHEERTRREISGLAAWPQPLRERLEPAVRALLAHAARVLEAPHVLLAWVEREEPWLYLASWRDGKLAWERESPADLEPLVAAPVGEGSFLCPAAGEPPVTLYRTPSGLARWRGDPLHRELRQRFGPVPVAGVRLRSESIEGDLLSLGKRGMTSDDLLLAEAVGGMVAARLDSVYLAKSLAEGAADEERIRLARDLHDGVLQSLTGVGLRLEAVRRLLEDGGDGAVGRVEELQRLLALEQRDLRFFIRELRPQPVTSSGESPGLARQVAELVHRLELEWRLKVELEMGDLEGGLPEGLAREIYHIVREAMVNAVRHGEASVVRVAIRAQGGRVTITVADNGSGFPVEGSFSHAELVGRSLGPRTLCERVAALDGAVALDTSRAGARLEILLPLGGAAP